MWKISVRVLIRNRPKLIALIALLHKFCSKTLYGILIILVLIGIQIVLILIKIWVVHLRSFRKTQFVANLNFPLIFIFLSHFKPLNINRFLWCHVNQSCPYVIVFFQIVAIINVNFDLSIAYNVEGKSFIPKWVFSSFPVYLGFMLLVAHCGYTIRVHLSKEIVIFFELSTNYFDCHFISVHEE